MVYGCWLIVWLAVGSAPPPAAPIPTSTGVAVRLLDPGPYLVGQAVALRVEGPPPSPGGVAARLVPPALVGADLIAVADPPRTEPACFWLVPRRAGPLVVPPFRAVTTDRTIGSRPLTITVGPVPPGGRPAAFGGGVGSCRLTTELAAPEARPGQTVGFTLRLTGPASLGASTAPDLSGWVGRPGAIEARLLGSDLVPTDPPTRTFRYELRPRLAGQWTLPPILVACYDPGSGRYLTQATSRLTLTVAAPARFDPATIRLPERLASGPNADPSRRLAERKVLVAGSVVVGVVAGLAIWGGWIQGGRGSVRSLAWRRAARRLARLDPAASDWADRVATDLERLLARALRRAVVALTPPEAAAALIDLTGDTRLADQASRVVAALDRLRFEPATATGITPDRAAGRAELLALLVAIAQSQEQPAGRLGRSGKRGDRVGRPGPHPTSEGGDLQSGAAGEAFHPANRAV